MKHSLDDDSPSTLDVRGAVAAKFKPDQKRKVKDVCQRLGHSTGYIEGTVYEKGVASEEKWEFVILAERGSRAHIVLSGKISRWFCALPLVVGAQIRLDLKGLVLEELPSRMVNRLTLDKVFQWREDVAIHVYNPKTTEEAFFDTWSDTASSEADPIITQNGHPCSVAKRQRRDPPTPSTTHDNASSPIMHCDTLPQLSYEELVDDISAATSASSHSLNADDNSQNPQMIPSPPPELSANADAMWSSEATSATCPQHVATPSRSILVAPETTEPSRVQDTPADAESSRPPKRKRSSPIINGKNKKALRKKSQRTSKQRRKKHANFQDVPGDSRHSGSSDDDEDYWDAAENDIPDDLLRDIDAPNVVIEDGTPPKAALAAVLEPATGPLPSPEVHDENNFHMDKELLREYTPLLKFGGKGLRNVIGVVAADPIISLTKTSEYKMHLNLFDWSNCKTSGLIVSLFDKAMLGLPKAEAGDVLILRSVVVDHKLREPSASGSSFKEWQWAVFQVKTGLWLNASSSLRNFRPGSGECKHSLRLGDWWRELPSDEVQFSAGFSRGRNHMLFSEVDCKDLYFDCTVEVLHSFPNQNANQPYTVFVTDYTRNPRTVPTQGNWCPAQLAPFVLRVEFWDASAEVAPTMKRGEYYSIRNIHYRLNGDAFEGKVQQNKIDKLDEDVLENQPHLFGLLKRKQDWENQVATIDGIPEFPHHLIEEATAGSHFDCTAEVLTISAKDGLSYLYVTDYTARTDLVPVAPTIVSGAPPESVVRIALKDVQVEISKSLEEGDFVAIRNLRLHGPDGGKLSGSLGGEQRLITKLNPKSTSNTRLKELLKRKKDYETSRDKLQDNEASRRASRRATAASSNSAADEKKLNSPSKGYKKGKGVDQYLTLNDVKASQACPSIFRVRARVVDFFPDNLRNCTVMRCTNCDQSIPKTRQKCVECDDAMEDTTFVQAFFNLYFSIEDEEGTTLFVSVSDERCSVLQDIAPEDVYEDVDDAFNMLVARLQPLLGDLLDVSGGVARRDHDHESGPVLDLTLGSWLPEGDPEDPESRAYIILRHSICD